MRLESHGAVTVRSTSFQPWPAMTCAHDCILDAIEYLFDDQVLFLEKLVRFKSVRNEAAAAQNLLEAAIGQRGFDVNCLRTDAAQVGRHPAFSSATIDYDDSWNLVGHKTSAGGGRSLAFNSHVAIPAT